MKDRFRNHLALPFLVLLGLSLAAVLLAACGGASSPSGEAPPPAAAAPPPPSPPPPTAPPAAGDLPAGGETIVAPGAVFDMPAGWVSQQPSSGMRLAQAQIPGDAGPGELAVFFFGAGGGGGTEANLERWAGQVEATAEPARGTFTLGTWTVSWIEVEGTLKPSTMGTGPNTPQPGSRLLGAVVEGEGGPWFFKATGPSDTLEAQREAFMAMLKSGRPHP